MKPYILTNISANYKVYYKAFNFNFFAKANNIFNIEYMVMEWYPMPKVNYEFGIKIIII